MGPFRINLSRHGIGHSFGGRRFHVSTTPRRPPSRVGAPARRLPPRQDVRRPAPPPPLLTLGGPRDRSS
ncbi:DUF4236 domain-containing protein [Nonomuraea salmonea]|uniref:DUF4236 domain-containing protein n=1 Tax=Nonomuraea salmonea TaxID=46181 RepID=UPI0031E9A131